MNTKMAAVCLATIMALSAGTAAAENINGKIGVTARLGFLIPSDSDYENLKLETDAGFNVGGGFIYGIDRNWAAEVDVSRTEFDADRVDGDSMGDFEVVTIALGGQYRFEINQANLTPYAGAGIDIIVSDYDPNVGSASVDTTVGVHATGGIDYFLNRNIALNAEAKVLVAPDTDIDGSNGDGNFDPSSVSGMFGVRFFFN